MKGFKTRAKNFLLKIKIHKVLPFLNRPSLLLSNTIKLSQWISDYSNDGNKKAVGFEHREDHYAYVYHTQVSNENICYLEFGVFQGSSIKWWSGENNNPASRFYGFDTFEGLPEKWGSYIKGDFYSNIPQIDDNRIHFIKGLFQDTLHEFINGADLNNRLLIHIDADLFSSTVFVLTTLAPYIKKGDVILFDEFNVPNDEFSAWEIFCRSYYIKYELLSATKNFFQVGVKIL